MRKLFYLCHLLLQRHFGREERGRAQERDWKIQREASVRRRMDRDNGEIYDVCPGRCAIAFSAVMIEPCRKKTTCLQNAELPLSVAIISVHLNEASILTVIQEKMIKQCVHTNLHL